jgi:nicotinamidase-related amidase
MAVTASLGPQLAPPLGQRSQAFLEYLDRFLTSLTDESLGAVIERAGGSAHVAMIAVDVVNGFCVAGPLASPRVGQIVPPIERLLRDAYEAGVRAFAVLRDSHSPRAPEFAQFGPHCLAGTAESALVGELAALPFAGSFADVPKNATSAWAGAEQFAAWVARQRTAGVRAFVVAGDCTDLCVYQTAMPLKLAANARDEEIEVLVLADCVDTYDLPVDAAERLGVMPHPGDLLHAVFLYHLQLNGVHVVRRLTT